MNVVRRKRLLRASDVSAGVIGGASWCMLLSGQLGRNPAWVDSLLVLSYVTAYTAFWAVVSRLAGACSESAGRGTPSPVGAVFVVSTVSVYLAFVLHAYFPSVFFSWSAVIIPTFILGLLFIAAVWAASAVPSRFTHSTRAINLTAALLLCASVGNAVYQVGTRFPVISSTQAALMNSASSPAKGKRITVLGADGVDWEQLNRLVSEGELPNLRTALRQGASGPLSTISAMSPLIWTSVATGVRPQDHGVVGFEWPYLRGTAVFLPHSPFDFIGKLVARVVPYREMRPFSSSNRRKRAIWEIASWFDKRVLLVNWWATYPAEQVNGVVVSDYAFPSGLIDKSRVRAMGSYPNLATPPSAQLIALKTMEAVVGDRSVRISYDTSQPATERNQYHVLRDELAWSVFKAFQDERFDLNLLFMGAIDPPSHLYSFDVFGETAELRPPKVSEELAAALWEATVLDAYRRLDLVVGALLQQVGEDELLLILSDHGWMYDGTMHRSKPDGVLILYGPSIRNGYRLASANVYDIFPTLCFILGLPISEELHGTVLQEAFQSDSAVDSTVTKVDSYGSRWDPQVLGPASLSRDYLDRLRSLGYVE